MSYLRSVQPLIAETLADLPSASASAGIKDAIIFVEEDGSVRRWDANSQSWTRRGGPVVGTVSTLNTPIPMSALSAPLKAQSDALTATGFATAAQGTRADSALQNASVFASSSQGSKADSALQAVPLASTSTNGLMLAADYTNLQTVVSAVQFYRRAVIVKDGISVATANSDTLIITGLPTKYLITRLSVYNASSALSTVSGGLYTGAGGSGVIIGPSVITAANSTSFFDFPSLVLTTRTNALLYFRITVPKSATTVSVLLELLNLG